MATKNRVELNILAIEAKVKERNSLKVSIANLLPKPAYSGAAFERSEVGDALQREINKTKAKIQKRLDLISDELQNAAEFERDELKKKERAIIQGLKGELLQLTQDWECSDRNDKLFELKTQFRREMHQISHLPASPPKELTETDARISTSTSSTIAATSPADDQASCCDIHPINLNREPHADDAETISTCSPIRLTPPTSPLSLQETIPADPVGEIVNAALLDVPCCCMFSDGSCGLLPSTAFIPLESAEAREERLVQSFKKKLSELLEDVNSRLSLSTLSDPGIDLNLMSDPELADLEQQQLCEITKLDDELSALRKKLHGLRLRMRALGGLVNSGVAIPEVSSHFQALRESVSPASAKTTSSSM